MGSACLAVELGCLPPGPGDPAPLAAVCPAAAAGGNCPDEGELFCSQPLQQPSDAADAAAAEGSEGGPAKRRSQASQRPSFVGLLVSQQGHDEPGGSAAGGCKPKLRCAGLTSQGMKGGEPLLTHVHLIRSSVTLQRLSPTARSRVGPGPAARHGNRAREDSARSPASPCHSSLMRTSVTCPAALAARGGTRFNASRRLPPLALACGRRPPTPHPPTPPHTHAHTHTHTHAHALARARTTHTPPPPPPTTPCSQRADGVGGADPAGRRRHPTAVLPGLRR